MEALDASNKEMAELRQGVEAQVEEIEFLKADVKGASESAV